MMCLKKAALCTAAAAFIFSTSAVFADYEWAADAVEYCRTNSIMTGNEYGDMMLGENLTREQMSKILIESFDVQKNEASLPSFSDIAPDRWSVSYITAFEPYMKVKKDNFSPEECVTREEFVSSIVLTSGLTEGSMLNSDILSVNFTDAEKVSDTYKKLMCIAVEKGYVQGDNGELRPKDLINRAEACTLLHRILLSKEGKLTLELGVKKSYTPIIGDSQVPLEQAIQWAKNRDAHQRFIDIAPVYWKYGELTGMRPEILYAQAAKETGFGKYGRHVDPEQNNWAGIKPGNVNEGHESFATPEDGVRAHFNHMAAYIGTDPVGEPHARYYNVKSLDWAGNIVTLEELGGKWCPDLYYGYCILHNYIEPMMNTEYTPLTEQMRQDLLNKATSGSKFDTENTASE